MAILIRRPHGTISVFCLLALLSCVPTVVPGDKANAPPNGLPTVVLLNVDLLRADRVGLLGATPSPTPAIDSFFSGGITFTDASSPASSTYTSATAIATGTEAVFNDHSLPMNWRFGGGPSVPETLRRDGLRAVDRLPTITQRLASAGYRTVAVNDFIHSGAEVLLDRGVDHYIDVTSPVLPGTARRVWSIEEQVSVMIEQLALASQRPGTQPLLLTFHPNSLHFPLRLDEADLSQDLRAMLEENPILWRQEGGQIEFAPAINVLGEFDPRLGPWEGPLTAPQRQVLEWAYDLTVRRVDAALAPLLTELAALDALVMLYSNHGIGLGAHGLNTVGVPWQECVHVPWLVRLPREAEGCRGPVNVAVSLVDLGPTLLDWLGLASPDDWQGRSLAKAACGALPSRTLIAGADLQHRFIRRGRWKLFVRGSVDRRLFDLSADPQETNDLSLAYPEIVRSLDAALLSLSAEQAQLRINSEFPQ
jgi:arylsulfatase A-like enzyme